MSWEANPTWYFTRLNSLSGSDAANRNIGYVSDECKVNRSENNVSSLPKWIRYFALDRRELWREYPDPASNPSYPNSIPDTYECRNTIDAVFATRLPQCATRSIRIADEQLWFSFKTFPYFGVNGMFKGVTQVVEALHGAPSPTPGSGSESPPMQEVQSVFDLSVGGVVIYRPFDDIIQSVNRRFAQESGYAVRDLEGMPGRILFNDSTVAFLRNIHYRMANAGGGMAAGQSLAIRNRLGQKEYFFCSVLLSPCAPDNGKSDNGVLHISIEETEKDDVSGVIKYGAHPHFIVEAFRDGLWEYDVTGKRFHYGKEYAHILGSEGLPENEGKPLEAALNNVYPGDIEMIMGSLRKLLKNGEQYRIFYRACDQKGKWHWIFSLSHAVLNDSYGRPVRVIGYHADISEAMESKRNLLDAEERLRIMFQNSGVGILLADQNGIICRINPAMTLIFGRDIEDIEGRELSEFAHHDSKADVIHSVTRLMHSGRREFVQDIRLFRPDGRETWVNATFSLSRKSIDGQRYIVVTGEDVTSSRAALEKLQYEATHDVMTGAWSRWIMFEQMDQHIPLAVRHNQAMAFCLCDLDHFKMVNDIHGHQMGDWVLIRFVELLRESLRDTDVIARYGGEEFAIIFPHTTVEGAVQSLERFLGRLRKEVFRNGDDEDAFHVTATVGVSGVIPGCSSLDVVAWADAALYHGKESGRNKVVVAKPPAGKWV